MIATILSITFSTFLLNAQSTQERYVIDLYLWEKQKSGIGDTLRKDLNDLGQKLAQQIEKKKASRPKGIFKQIEEEESQRCCQFYKKPTLGRDLIKHPKNKRKTN